MSHRLAHLCAALCLGAVCIAPTLAAEPLTVTVHRLTLDTAERIALGAIKACRAKGLQVSATVVDRDGIVQATLRDTLAPPVSLDISRQKAYTAAMFGIKGTAMGPQAASPLALLGDGLAFTAGSVPIQAGGRLYGAVGVSGAPDGKVDEECAQAGLDAVLPDLEMQ
ncbi:MAG: GlcG/HbpS family heme-binding protein [Thiomonas sp.]